MADQVLKAAQPLLERCFAGYANFDSLSFKTSGTTLYVEAKFPQHLADARERMLAPFVNAGWGFKEDQRKARLMFSMPNTVARANLRVVK